MSAMRCAASSKRLPERALARSNSQLLPQASTIKLSQTSAPCTVARMGFQPSSQCAAGASSVRSFSSRRQSASGFASLSIAIRLSSGACDRGETAYAASAAARWAQTRRPRSTSRESSVQREGGSWFL
eukprot:5219026-Prymnesium_polylepis.3